MTFPDFPKPGRTLICGFQSSHKPCMSTCQVTYAILLHDVCATNVENMISLPTTSITLRILPEASF